MRIARIAIVAGLMLAGSLSLSAAAQTANQTDTTRAVVQRYWAAANAGDSRAAASLFAADATYRDKTFDFEIRGIAKIEQMLRGAFDLLKPVNRKIVTQAYDGPSAVLEWEASGTHVGPALGVAPTNKTLKLRAVSLILVRDGKIIAVTDYMDRAGLEAQLKP